MSETNQEGPWVEFQSRIRDLTDTMLERLKAVTHAKDVDDKEARIIGSLILKTLKLWDHALVRGRHDPHLQECLRRIEKQSQKNDS